MMCIFPLHHFPSPHPLRIIISAQKVSVAQQIKSWPADLAVLSLIPAANGNLDRKWDSFAHGLSFSHSYRPMTGILLKRA